MNSLVRDGNTSISSPFSVTPFGSGDRYAVHPVFGTASSLGRTQYGNAPPAASHSVSGGGLLSVGFW